MITLITGAPGTGKSNAVVSMLAELGKDRAVYVFGIPDLKIPHVQLDDPTTWPDSVPDGSCIVLDEVQNVWRPRGPGQKVPDHVSKLETHRHRGLDFYIITQGPNLLDANVRALTGRHVHLRDLGILGRWWYEWPECADNCRTAWKNAPIKKRYRLDKSAQKKYKSASIHVKPVPSVPWMLAVMVLALCLVGFLTWKSFGMIQAKMNPGKPAAVVSSQGGQIVDGSPGALAVATAKFIDDRVDFVPRVSSKPESAPAFDGLRQVVAMPRVAGAMVMGSRVKCVTQQGTDAGLSERECREWMSNPPFNPYEPPKAVSADLAGTASADSRTVADRAPVQGPTAVVMDAGIERAGLARSGKGPG